MSKFIKLTRSECGTEIMQNVDAIKRFSQYAEMGWTYVITTDGYELNVRETPEQILAQIGGSPQLPEEWMAAANTAHDISDVLQRLESNFDDSKPEAIKRCISSLVKDAVSLEATLHAIPGRSNP